MARFLSIVLGLFLITMGLNKFFGFLSMPEMSSEATQFMMAMMETGYFMGMVAVVEITVGAMLLAAATTPFALLLLAPLSVNLILFHLFLDPSTIGPALFVAVSNVGLGVYHFKFYRSIFAKVFTERVFITDKESAVPTNPVAVIN